MYTRGKNKLRAVAIFTGFACVGLISTALAESTWRPDAWVTAKTKIALATEEAGATYVNVDTVDGRVTLHGKVYSEAEKAHAEKVARGIEGATEVRNLLQVVPKEEMELVKREDAAVKEAVAEALEGDDELAASSIYVQSVNDGVVLLAGDADSLLAHLQAIRTASAVDGVRSVQTEAKTGDRLYDENLWHDPQAPDLEEHADGVVAGAKKMAHDTADSAAKMGSSVVDGTKKLAAGAANTLDRAGDSTTDLAKDAKDETVELGRDIKNGTVDTAERIAGASKRAASATSGAIRDAWITTATKSRLLASPDTPALSINVDTSNGVVTLFGRVPSESARKAAVMEARAVSGVREVEDNLEVDSSMAEAQIDALDDGDVQSKVRNELEQEGRFRTANIEVAVDDGVVELSGTAPSREVKLAAATKARAIDGVRAVRNNIRVATDANGRIGG